MIRIRQLKKNKTKKKHTLNPKRYGLYHAIHAIFESKRSSHLPRTEMVSVRFPFISFVIKSKNNSQYLHHSFIRDAIFFDKKRFFYWIFPHTQAK